MSSHRFVRLAAIAAIACAGLRAQDAFVTLQVNSANVLVKGRSQLSASITDVNGTPLDAGTLAWSSSDNTLASVTDSGMVTGLLPGTVRVGVTDRNTGAAASALLHIVPSSFTVKLSSPTVIAGETAQLSAQALDASGAAIPGLRFQYRSGQTSVAAISAEGVITGVSEGFVTLQAAIAGASSDPGLIATTQIRVLPKPRYKIRKVLSTDSASTTTIAAVSSVVAVSAAKVGAIVTLANGGQAAVLVEGAKVTPIAVAGQTLPATDRLVLRIDAISANARGDVALLIEYPTQWCSASVFLFPHGQPEIELGAANCNNGLAPHSLTEDGRVVYRNNDQIWSASATTPPTLLFSLATQPKLSDPVRSVNGFSAAGGAFIAAATLNSGIGANFWSDGSTFTRVYRSGDTVRNAPTNGLDLPVGTSGGQFYGRANGNGFEALVELGSFGMKTLLVTGDPAATGKLGWIHNLYDATSGGALFACDINAPNDYHSAVCVWKNDLVSEAAALSGYGGMIAGALPSDGVPLVSAVLKADAKVPGLRSLPQQQDPRLVLAAGATFPIPAPAGIDWHYASRGGAAAVLPVHAAGEAIALVDSGVRNLAILGAPLPNGKVATWIGAAIANTAGDIVFTAGYPTGSALFRYRAGAMETVQDTAVTSITALNVSWFNSYRGRYLAMNNRGDTVHVSQFNSGGVTQIVIVTGGLQKLVAAQYAAAPSGSLFSNFNSTAVDENGRVLFTATTSDGKTAVYFWDGNTIQRVIGVGDQTPSGTVNEVSNIAGGGRGFAILLAIDNYRARELRYFDGALRTVESTDNSLLDGVWMNYFWMNEATLSANGDTAYQVQTQDGGIGVYTRRADGSLGVVARSRDPLPGNEWLIFPLTVSSSANGEVWFTAFTWNNGSLALALYLATPQ